MKYAKISSAQNGGIKRGVIFATYSSLISESQNASTKVKYNSRLKQLIQWLGGEEFDGVVSYFSPSEIEEFMLAIRSFSTNVIKRKILLLVQQQNRRKQV